MAFQAERHLALGADGAAYVPILGYNGRVKCILYKAEELRRPYVYTMPMPVCEHARRWHTQVLPEEAAPREEGQWSNSVGERGAIPAVTAHLLLTASWPPADGEAPTSGMAARPFCSHADTV